ncbi:hypothetical protein MF406_18055 (plasmid) [Georgenia sp. TF02-10]|nr:hypothetical protein [Georgenia sp. TF02-10]UNX56555.1 hypothetical protein MF406_18055 [Georgenia sp. TF02-10]
MAEERERPTVNQPLNGPRRSPKSLLIVIAILVAIAAVMVLIGWLRYNT